MVKLLSSTKAQPLVSIILPIYNSAPYLKESLDSLRSQSFKNFEIIAINDGSTDNSASILKKYKDDRLVIVDHKKNRGLVKTLNESLKIARGKYIARMDPDDIAHSQRLKKQFNFMEQNPDIDVLGTWIKNFGLYNYVWNVHAKDPYIKAKLLFENSIAHPSVMMKRSSLIKLKVNYDEQIVGAEDYMLWSVLAYRGLKFANLQEPLLKYRTHSTQIGESKKLKQQDSSWLVRAYNLKRLGLKPTQSQRIIHQKLSSWIPLSGYVEAYHTGLWVSKILLANYMSHIYSQSALSKILGEKWAVSCYLSANNNLVRALYLLTCPWLLPLAIYVLYQRSRGTLYENC